jgi:hypothetical protein
MRAVLALGTLGFGVIAVAWIAEPRAFAAPSVPSPSAAKPPLGWSVPDKRLAVQALVGTEPFDDAACAEGSECGILTRGESRGPRNPWVAMDVPISDLPRATVMHLPAETDGKVGAPVLRIFGYSEAVPEWAGTPEPMNSLPPAQHGFLQHEDTMTLELSQFRFTVVPSPGDARPRETRPFSFRARGPTKSDGTIPFDWITGLEDEVHPVRVREWAHGYAQSVASGHVFALRVDDGSGAPVVAVIIDNELTILGGDHASAGRVGFIGSWQRPDLKLTDIGIDATTATVFADVSQGTSEAASVLRLRIR